MVSEYSPHVGIRRRGSHQGGFCTHFLWFIVTLTVTLLAKMLLPNQRRIQYKVTFFTREVTFFDGTYASNTIAQGQVSRRVVRISGCGGRMPSTQHIAVTLTPWATWQCAGLRAYVHHSRRKLTLTVPYPKEAKKAV